MNQTLSSKVIDLTPYLKSRQSRRRRERLQEWSYTVLALWTQYLSAGMLALYALLRVTVCPEIPLGRYSGPMAALWAVSFFLLLTSYVCDLLLWREEWAEK